MRQSFALALALGAGGLAQSVVDFGKLPACAHQCSVLQQAETKCVPPAAPVTRQATYQYQSCLCQSALLATLRSSGSVCQQNNVCSPGDAAAISSYYNTLCNGPAVASASSSITSATSFRLATAGSKSIRSTSKSDDHSWLRAHWPWVVMAAVVGVAIIGFWVGGCLLRRHMHRKRDRQAKAGPPVHGSTQRNSSVLSQLEANTPAMSSRPPTLAGVRRSTLTDSSVGAVAPPRSRLRSRSSTLQSIGRGYVASRSPPEPVVWGPHQHHAAALAQAGNDASRPPSPMRATPNPPDPVFSSPDATASEPRFLSYRSTPSDVPIEFAPGVSHSPPPRPHSARDPSSSSDAALRSMRSDGDMHIGPSPLSDMVSAENAATPGPSQPRKITKR